VERDRHGRLVAKVFSPNEVDIGRRLVSSGWALAYRRYSRDYFAAEQVAAGQACDVEGPLLRCRGRLRAAPLYSVTRVRIALACPVSSLWRSKQLQRGLILRRFEPRDGATSSSTT
jgi:hypothetical protein